MTFSPSAPVAPERPGPSFRHCVYGVPLEYFGEDGRIVALGHVPLRRFVAACNALGRRESGLVNLLDDPHATYLDAVSYCSHRWGIPCQPDGDCTWSLEWVPSGTRAGAIAVTVFAP